MAPSGVNRGALIEPFGVNLIAQQQVSKRSERDIAVSEDKDRTVKSHRSAILMILIKMAICQRTIPDNRLFPNL
jgi:hypothetical protein